MSLELSRRDVETFRIFLGRETGLRFEEDKLDQLKRVLAARIRATSSGDASTYLDYLSKEPRELGHLGRDFSVPETYFFRNWDQFRAFEALLRSRAASGLRRLRILSAGCASGEEPYSIAVMIRESLPASQDWEIGILAVDINPDAIQRARVGGYNEWSLRETPDRLRMKYFAPSGDRAVIDPAIRAMVGFEEKNLARAGDSFWRPETYDFVFCRNVLMYFTRDSSRRVVAGIARAMAPGAFLFLGHAENLRGISRHFSLCHTHDTFYYQLRATCAGEDTTVPGAADSFQEDTLAPGGAPAPSWMEMISESSRRIEQIAESPSSPAGSPAATVRPPAPSQERGAESTGSILRLIEQERYEEALRALEGTAHDTSAGPLRLLLKAALLASCGDPSAAEKACSEILSVDELNAEAHLVLALCRERMADLTGAIEHDRIAAYLDPDFSMAHLHFGLLARHLGDTATARREIGLALELLPREDTTRVILFGGGFERDALVKLCEGELRTCAEEA